MALRYEKRTQCYSSRVENGEVAISEGPARGHDPPGIEHRSVIARVKRSRVLMTPFPVHSFFGFMNRLPYLLLGSPGSRIRLKCVVACLALKLRATHPPARRNPASLQSRSNRALRLLLMPVIGKAALLGRRSDFRES